MATKPRQNIFTAAAKQRQAEQDQIEAAVTGSPPDVTRGRGAAGAMKKRGADATTMTLSVSLEDKTQVKRYALEQHTTVSDLFHRWIEEHCN